MAGTGAILNAGVARVVQRFDFNVRLALKMITVHCAPNAMPASEHFCNIEMKDHINLAFWKKVSDSM